MFSYLLIVVHCGVYDATLDYDMIKSRPAAFVKFFAPWCSHCSHMQPAFEELADSFDSPDTVSFEELE